MGDQRKSKGRKPPKRDSSKRSVARAAPRSKPKQSTRKTGAGESRKRATRPARPPQSVPAPTALPSDADQDAEAPPDAKTFPVVGIGSSAGGLEALEKFLSHVPPDSGAAYVVIQHLDPRHKDLFVELLQPSSKVPILRAEDDMVVEPDHCYVIPPNNDMSLSHGKLHLLPPAAPRGLNLPIDFFFRSLAQDQLERSIGVILSGMGSDGTLGLRAIKERAGAAFVQTPSTAQFDGMPRSAIDAGLADVVDSVEELPHRIAAYREHAPYMRPRPAPSEPSNKSQNALEKVLVLLRAQTGNDFFQYKRSTIQRRIERRLGLHQIDGIANYVRFLRDNPRELDLLFKELLVGVTSFFRDPAAWDHLKERVLPELLTSRSKGRPLRAWVAGCSTGEEAYSLAILFAEAIALLKPDRNITLQIFATDLDRDAIEKARIGLYPETIVADVSAERLRRFFVEEDRGYRVGKEIREMVVFAPQNLIMDPPFTKLDILCCRNVLIYLSGDLQKKLMPLFHYSLYPDGVLFLGSAETVGSFTNLFAPTDSKARIYRRLEQPVAGPLFEFPTTFLTAPTASGDGATEHAPVAPSQPINLERSAERVILHQFAPLGVLCNEKGDVLYVSGRSGKYFEPAVGKANLNILAMARDGLRHELSSAFSRALREDRVVEMHDIAVGSNGGTQHINLRVQRLSEPKELRGTVIVVITDVLETSSPVRRGKPRQGAEPSRLTELLEDLQRAREEVQSTREEMQASQEELKSTNEELQSANEELQSTNEELTTSKEEMQSLNEELQTVNHELQAKVDELSRSNNDMKNLLNSTDIATLFLDGELRVRRFTPPTARIIKLIPGDTGRPITDIASELDYADMADDAREVLRTLVFQEKQCRARDGRWFNVRILPYRTRENVIDGVVITFTDASAARALESSLREQLRQMAEALPTLVWGARPDGSCDYVNRRWVEYTAVPEAEHFGYGWLRHVHPADRDRVQEEWRGAVQRGSDFDSEFRIRSANGDYRWFQTRGAAIRDGQAMILKWIVTSSDVDHLKRAEVDRTRGE